MDVIGTCVRTKQGYGKEEEFESLHENLKYNPVKVIELRATIYIYC
jgi:hypothetical protein